MNNPPAVKTKTLNLIPIKWSKSGRESLIKQRLYLTNTILSVAGIVALFAGGIYYFWKNTNYRSTVAQNQKVAEKLLAVLETEGRFMLLKNQLAQVTAIRQKDANSFFFLMKDLLLTSGMDVFLVEYEVTAGTAKLTFNFTNPSEINLFLEATNNYEFKSVVVDSVEKDAGSYVVKVNIGI